MSKMADKDKDKDDKEKEKDKGITQASFQISRQLDQEKISFLTKRIDELLKSNNDLRGNASRNEKDTHDIVLYFQREMEMKDEIIAKLNEELVKRETQLKFELEKLKKKFDVDMADLKRESDNTISALTTTRADKEADLAATETFRNNKDAFMMQLERLEKEVRDQRQQMFDALDEQERKFLEEKSQLLRDLDDQRALLAEAALKDAREAMGAEVKKILAENNRIYEEVKFLVTTTTELQTDKVQCSDCVCVYGSLSVALRCVAEFTGIQAGNGEERSYHSGRERGGICEAVVLKDQRDQSAQRKVRLFMLSPHL
jgi:hypothetical protein